MRDLFRVLWVEIHIHYSSSIETCWAMQDIRGIDGSMSTALGSLSRIRYIQLCSLRERTINCWSRASPSSRSATILSKKNQSWKPERLLGRRRRGSSNHESIFPELTVFKIVTRQKPWHARNRNVWIHQRPEITDPELPIDEYARVHNWCGDYYRVLPRVLLLLFSYSNRSFLYIPHLTLYCAFNPTS